MSEKTIKPWSCVGYQIYHEGDYLPVHLVVNSLNAYHQKMKEVELLEKKLASLEDIDEVSAGYRDLCKIMLEDMQGEGMHTVDYEKELKELER